MFDFRRRYVRFSLKLIWSPQSRRQNRSLGIDQFSVLSCITDMTILSIVICASKLVYGTKNVKSTNSSQIHALEDNLRTYNGHFSDRLQLPFLEGVIFKAKRWNCVQLLRLCCAPVHVLPCHRTTRQFLREVSHILVIFQLRSQKFVI